MCICIDVYTYIHPPQTAAANSSLRKLPAQQTAAAANRRRISPPPPQTAAAANCTAANRSSRKLITWRLMPTAHVGNASGVHGCGVLRCENLQRSPEYMCQASGQHHPPPLHAYIREWLGG